MRVFNGTKLNLDGIELFARLDLKARLLSLVQ